jgi:hypothetical protein
VLLRLLTLPISGPIAGIKYCLEKVAEVAEREMWDEEPVREELILLNEAYEEGKVGEEDFRAREAELLTRLREIRERRKAQAQAQADADAEAGAQVDKRRTVIISTPDEIE